MSIVSKWFTKATSAAVDTTIGSIGNAIDSLITSDEERGQLKIAMAKEMNGFKISQMEIAAASQKEVTSRHKADMMSDSRLAKNVRPIVCLAYNFGAVSFLFVIVFYLPPGEYPLLQSVFNLFMMAAVAVNGFYFGGRSWEKIKRINLPAKNPAVDTFVKGALGKVAEALETTKEGK